jgi:minor extracellular serine protease Vpr
MLGGTEVKTKFFVILALALVLALLLPTFAAGQDSPELRLVRTFEPIKAITGNENGKELPRLNGAIRTEDGRVRVIVELRQSALAAYDGGFASLAPTSVTATGEKLDVVTPAREAYLAYLDARQDAFVSTLATVAPSATTDYRYTVLINAVAMAVDEDQIAAIQALPDVLKVYPDEMNYITLDSSIDLINSPAMWAELGGQETAGEGIKVAVVDTGIRPENPLFDDDGYTAPDGYPLGYCLTDPTFCNNKIIAARYYTPTFAVHVDEVNTPLDIDGHGTHTASTSAGNAGVIADAGDGIEETLSGVAPRAYVMAYKALFTVPDGSTASGSNSMLMAALQDSALDGADVVNNSWGGSTGGDPASSPYTPLIQNMVGSGIVVVVSAGNAGPGPQTIGCPGCVEEVITVAASTTNRIHANTLDILGPGTSPAELVGIAAVQGSGPLLAGDVGPAVINFAGAVDPANIEGCSAFPADSFDGEIALIKRGSCNFSVKVNNAANAGAIAAVIYTQFGGPPSVMGGLEATTIPSVMIDNASGEAVAAWIMDNPTATAQINDEVERVTNDDWQDIFAGFSSRGPNGDPDIFKPDITAPGVNILAGYSPNWNGEKFAFLGGTSMSAPHITGAAALMVQLHPDWSPQQVKSALTTTAVQTLLKEDGFTDADPFDMGSGRVDLERAIDAGATFSQASFSEGDCFLDCGWSSTITNVGTSLQTWTATVVEAPGVEITVSPATVILPPGHTASFNIDVDVTEADTGEWYFGWVIWSDGDGPAVDAYLPLAVNNVASTDPLAITKTVDDSVATSGSTVTYEIELSNQETVSRTFSLLDVLPPEAEYVDGSATGGLVYDEATESLSWSGELGPLGMDIVEVEMTGYIPLSLFVAPYPCPNTACDDTGWVISGLDFYYLGQHYDRVTWITNGYIYVDTPGPTTGYPPPLPNPAVPNGVIAPLWTDIDLDGGDGEGGGTWYVAGLSDGVNDYTVFEWTNAEQWGDSDTNYTFQIWIMDGTSNIWFTYADLTGGVPHGAIGVESADGMLGHTYFYRDYAAPPSPPIGELLTPGGDDLLVVAEADIRNFSFRAMLTGDEGERVTNIAELVVGGTDFDLARADTILQLNYLYTPLMSKN